MTTVYQPPDDRYGGLDYRRCGRSGVKLPAVSLGLWHNFGGVDRFETARDLVRHAFDRGITHFDLANNYGPPPGSAESVFGEIMRRDLAPWRDEIVVSTKAGYVMGPGPYQDGGSRKYLLSSLDRSLQRMGLDHVDIFYHHRPDPHTPLEETMAALDHAVRSGRAQYVGVSNYDAERTRQAARILRSLGTPCLIHQARYNLLDRAVEPALLPALADEGIGCIAFSPLAQGVLTGRYRGGQVPEDSRAARAGTFLRPEHLTPQRMAAVEALAGVAASRGIGLTALALAWVLRQPTVASVLIGASRTGQIDEAVAAAAAPALDEAALAAVERALEGA